MSTAALPGASDTIVALATAGARSALAMIRLSGSNAHAIAEQVLTPWHNAPRRAFLATLRDCETRKEIDRGLITVFAAPASFTGEDMVELSLHGGEVGPSRAMNTLIACGARQALPGEFTRRALMNGKLDLLQAEAIADLIDSRSEAMHEIALGQLAGHLSARLNTLRAQIIEVEALLAYDVDFPEEDNGPISSVRIESAARDVLASIDGLVATTATGEMVRSGATIVIAGAPNAGKSSLFNALAGTQRAIVTDVPGTTRDALEATMDFGPWPVRLVDTAGLRASTETIERLGIEVAERYIGSAVVVLACGDDARSLALAVRNIQPLTDGFVLVVGTKRDAEALPDVIEGKLDYVRVSAKTGEGLDELVSRVVAILDRNYEPLLSGAPIVTRERHRSALTNARAELAAFIEQCVCGFELPATVAAVHLHAARSHLEELVGAVGVEQVLDRVFSAFCVGK
jgi:tRNA modification GTPase